MTPKAAQGGRAVGTSFKGVFQYLQNDKRNEGESRSSGDDRVDWQAFRNLAVDDPSLAWRIMMATANQQDALKRDAGASVAGNKSDKVVFHYSLGWHPDERAGLTKAEMLRAADESLRALGAQDHQAAFIAHNDTKHPHVHVVINRVNPENGKMLDLWKYQERLSKWALSYEQERGKIWCEQRAENWKRRDLGEVFSADKGAAYHRQDQAGLGHANDNDIKRLLADQKAKDAALTAQGEAMDGRHSQAWRDLSAWYKAGKDKIAGRDRPDRPTPFKQAIADVKAQFKPLRSALGKKQWHEARAFEKREAGLLGRLENAVLATKLSKELNDKGEQAQTSLFNHIVSSAARKATLEKTHRMEWRTLNAAQKAEIGLALDKVRKNQSDAYSAHRKRFATKRDALKADQSADRQSLRQQWQERKIERARVSEIIGQKQTMDEARAQDHDQAQTTKEHRDTFKKASDAKVRKRSRGGRSRSRTRER